MCGRQRESGMTGRTVDLRASVIRASGLLIAFATSVHPTSKAGCVFRGHVSRHQLVGNRHRAPVSPSS